MRPRGRAFPTAEPRCRRPGVEFSRLLRRDVEPVRDRVVPGVAPGAVREGRLDGGDDIAVGQGQGSLPVLRPAPVREGTDSLEHLIVRHAAPPDDGCVQECDAVAVRVGEERDVVSARDPPSCVVERLAIMGAAKEADDG